MNRLFGFACTFLCRSALVDAADVAAFHVILELESLLPNNGYTKVQETVEFQLMNMSDFKNGRTDLVTDVLRSRGYESPKLQIGGMDGVDITTKHGKKVDPPPLTKSVPDEDFPLDVKAVYSMNTIPDDADTSGSLVIDVFPSWAPIAAARVRELVSSKAWEQSRFFKVSPNVMAQWGLPATPAGDGAECASEAIEDDAMLADGPKNTPFTVAFASAGEGMRNCQAFINYGDNPNLNAVIRPFGQVVKGILTAQRIFDTSPYRKAQPEQAKIIARGNTYLDENFPELSQVKAAKIVEGPFPRNAAMSIMDIYNAEVDAREASASRSKSDEL